MASALEVLVNPFIVPAVISAGRFFDHVVDGFAMDIAAGTATRSASV